jgi:hypothetical protein
MPNDADVSADAAELAWNAAYGAAQLTRRQLQTGNHVEIGAALQLIDVEADLRVANGAALMGVGQVLERRSGFDPIPQGHEPQMVAEAHKR